MKERENQGFGLASLSRVIIGHQLPASPFFSTLLLSLLSIKEIMSLPDYEGKDYFESDHDEPDIVIPNESPPQQGKCKFLKITVKYVFHSPVDHTTVNFV